MSIAHAEHHHRLHPQHLAIHELTHLPELILFLSSGVFQQPLAHGIRPGDRQTLLWLPGNSENGRTVSHMQERFSDPEDLNYDSREWGLGTPNIRHLDDYVPLLDAQLADVEGTVTLIGHSAGGWIAGKYAEARPDRVRQIFRLATPVYPGHEGNIPSTIPVHDICGVYDPLAQSLMRRTSAQYRVKSVLATHEGILWNARAMAYMGHHFQDVLD